MVTSLLFLIIINWLSSSTASKTDIIIKLMLIKKKGKAAIYVIKREGEQQEKEWTRNYI